MPFPPCRAALVAAGLLAAAAPAADPAPKVKAGDPFPVVPLPAVQTDRAVPGKSDGTPVSIADLKGKVVVVFFYPKASTPGCTTESCGFRDAADKFPKDVVLIGASADDAAGQTKFINDHKLPFALWCDTDRKLIDALGIQMAARPLPRRVTFVVGRDGKVLKVYETVKPAGHPAEVLAYVEGLAK